MMNHRSIPSAWRGEGRLAALTDPIEFGLTPEQAIERLESAIEDVQRAIDDMRSGAREAEHYER